MVIFLFRRIQRFSPLHKSLKTWMSEFCILKLGLGTWSYLESRASFVKRLKQHVWSLPQLIKHWEIVNVSRLKYTFKFHLMYMYLVLFFFFFPTPSSNSSAPAGCPIVQLCSETLSLKNCVWSHRLRVQSYETPTPHPGQTQLSAVLLTDWLKTRGSMTPSLGLIILLELLTELRHFTRFPAYY